MKWTLRALSGRAAPLPRDFFSRKGEAAETASDRQSERDVRDTRAERPQERR